MKPARDWKSELAKQKTGDAIQLIEGRGGDPTLKVGNVFLHSRYNPRQEAERLVDSADLDLKRPILVIGLGLGYHILELKKQGAESVAVVEPDRTIAKLALDGPMAESDVLLGLGEPQEIAGSDEFKKLVASVPQLLIHPPTAHIHPEYASEMTALVSKAVMCDNRLRIAVVGPLFGGSLPIAGYLATAFEKLGHASLFVDNSQAWDVYNEVTEGVKTKHAANQLGVMLTNFLNEWSYARVMEFAPDICIVIAQAPVGKQFPLRLAKEGIVTAFWFVENWRHLAYWQDIAPFYDYFFHIQPGEFDDKLDEAGCMCHALVQTGCDPEIHAPVELTDEEHQEYDCDISFAGAGYFNRTELFKGLTDYNFKIWGVNWSGRELYPLLCRPDERFTSEQFAKIVAASKININLHSSTYHDGVDPKCDAINPRVFEIAASGAFQLCDPAMGLDNFFDLDSELPSYRDLKELRSKIDYYLEHSEERQEVATRARERVLKDHTYEKRAQQMLDLIFEAHGARILHKGIRVQKTCSEILDQVGRDTDLGRFIESLPSDMLFTNENVDEHLARFGKEVSYPEGVFMYMREVREFAETLLENPR